MPNITVSRHCMQNLLHAAQSFEPGKCCGLLAGRRNMIEMKVPVTDFLQSERYRNTLEQQKNHDCELVWVGVYLSSDSLADVDRGRLNQLADLYSELGGHGVPGCMVIETGHAGRMDALLFSGPQLDQAMTLEMLEEGICTGAA